MLTQIGIGHPNSLLYLDDTCRLVKTRTAWLGLSGQTGVAVARYVNSRWRGTWATKLPCNIDVEFGNILSERCMIEQWSYVTLKKQKAVLRSLAHSTCTAAGLITQALSQFTSVQTVKY